MTTSYLSSTADMTATGTVGETAPPATTPTLGIASPTAPVAIQSATPTAITQTVIQQAVPMAILPQAEFQNLIMTRNSLMEENATLKQRLTILLNEATESNLRIKQKDVEIEELRRENSELKARIAALELQNEELVHRVENLEYQNEYNKFLVVLQDLNRFLKLEKEESLPIAIRRKIRVIRSSRVANCHYILEDDEDVVVEYKKDKAMEKIKEMSVKCRNIFMKKNGPDFLETLERCITSKCVVSASERRIRDDDRIDADEWWEDP